jgi:hypothetical protein
VQEPSELWACKALANAGSAAQQLAGLNACSCINPVSRHLWPKFADSSGGTEQKLSFIH